MNEHIVYGAVDRRTITRDSAGRITLAPSPNRARIPVLRAYPTPAAGLAAHAQLTLDLELLAFDAQFPDGSLFAVGTRAGRAHRTVGLFDDFTAALTVAADPTVFPGSQGTIDLTRVATVFGSAAQFHSAHRVGVPLLDWQGLNAEFFVLAQPGPDDPAVAGVPTLHRAFTSFGLRIAA